MKNREKKFSTTRATIIKKKEKKKKKKKIEGKKVRKNKITSRVSAMLRKSITRMTSHSYSESMLLYATVTLDFYE